MLVAEKIESVFIPMLQHNIKIMFNGKQIRSGKLLLVTQKSANISIILQDEKSKAKSYELPYPFEYNIQESNNSDKKITLNYTIPALSNNRSTTIEKLDKYISSKKKNHRFLGGSVYIVNID